MKKMLMVSNGEHFAARFCKATLAILIGLALGTAFWVTSTATAQEMSPAKMIESHLPAGKTMQNAGKADFLAAVCEAVKANKPAAGQIVQAAVAAHPEWRKDVLRTAFSCVGSGDCRLLGRILHGAIEGSPGHASELTNLAVELAPDCAGSFQGPRGGGENMGEGIFGNPPGTNLNPPPGSIGGGGGQGNIVAVCFNGQTQFVTPERAQELLAQGGTLGACQVTSTVNQ